MAKVQDHSGVPKESIIQITEPREGELRVSETSSVMGKELKPETQGLTDVAEQSLIQQAPIRSSRNTEARASKTWQGVSMHGRGVRLQKEASREMKGMVLLGSHMHGHGRKNGQVPFSEKQGEEREEQAEEVLQQGIKKVLKQKYGRWAEEYRVRKAINRPGKSTLERMDRGLHFVGTNGSMLVPRKQDCGRLGLEEGIGQLSSNPLRTGLTEEVRSIAPPILLEKEGPLLETEKELVEKVYLHPIIFPPGAPEQITRYYRRLYQIANVNNLPHQSLFIDHFGQPCINRKEFQIKSDNLKQKWLVCFVRDFIEKRIPELTCPDTLAYWEWFFTTFTFEEPLGVVAYPGEEPERLKLTWAHCTHFLRDELFYLELTKWIESELTHFEPQFYHFYCEVKSKPQLIGPPIPRPERFTQFQHLCTTHVGYQWNETDFMQEHPHLSHLYYGLKFVQEHENARNQLFRVYKNSLQARWHEYEQLLRQKYDAYLFSGPYQQPALAMQLLQSHQPMPTNAPQPQPVVNYQDENSVVECTSQMQNYQQEAPPQQPQQAAQYAQPQPQYPASYYQQQPTMSQEIPQQTQPRSHPQLQSQPMAQYGYQNYASSRMSTASMNPAMQVPMAQQIAASTLGHTFPPASLSQQQPMALMRQQLPVGQPKMQSESGQVVFGGGVGMESVSSEQQNGIINGNGTESAPINLMEAPASVPQAAPSMPQAPPSGFSEAPQMREEGKREEEDKVIVISESNSEHSETRVTANVFEVLKQLNSNITKLAEGRVYGN